MPFPTQFNDPLIASVTARAARRERNRRAEEALFRQAERDPARQIQIAQNRQVLRNWALKHANAAAALTPEQRSAHERWLRRTENRMTAGQNWNRDAIADRRHDQKRIDDIAQAAIARQAHRQALELLSADTRFVESAKANAKIEAARATAEADRQQAQERANASRDVAQERANASRDVAQTKSQSDKDIALIRANADRDIATIQHLLGGNDEAKTRATALKQGLDLINTALLLSKSTLTDEQRAQVETLIDQAPGLSDEEKRRQKRMIRNANYAEAQAYFWQQAQDALTRGGFGSLPLAGTPATESD